MPASTTRTGGPWAPLAPATLRYKKGAQILTETKKVGLRGTIAYDPDKRKVAVGTNRIYGAIHQLGGQVGPYRKVTIPARPYLGITDENKQEFYTIVREYLEAAGIDAGNTDIR